MSHKNHKNTQIEKEFTNKNGENVNTVLDDNGIQNLTEGIDSSVMEKISSTPGKNKSISLQKKDQKSKKSIFNFSFSEQIKNLLPKNSGNKNPRLPKKEIQRKLIKKSLKAKQKKLLAQANKIVRSNKFSASKLENLINQIRYIQKLLQELMNIAEKTIEKLYKKFVLKVG